MRSLRLTIGFVMLVCIASLGTDITPAQEMGIKVKKPVLGAACKTCPWGVLGEMVKAALKPYGYDVQVCYNCWRGDAPRIVASASIPPSLQNNTVWPGEDNTDQLPDYIVPPPPDAPIEFGVTGAQFVWGAYQGTGNYAGEKPRQNLRLFANIEGGGSYFLVAVKADSGITDLSQIKEKRWPVRVLGGGAVGGLTGASAAILAYYGLTQKSIEAAGGIVGAHTVAWPEEERQNASSPPNEKDLRDTFDIIIGGAGLANNPENMGWYYITQRYDLNYLQLPEELLAKLAKDYGMVRRDIPLGYLRGIDRPIHTVVSAGGPGTVVYGRADNPDEFAYTVAKALDEHQDLLQWGINSYSYNRRTVWKAEGIPLHPGAERYYREMGYMK